MRWLIFLLTIPGVWGMVIAASPQFIELEEGEGNFLLLNPNNYSVDYFIDGNFEILPKEGRLQSYEEQHIFIKGKQNGNITVLFSGNEEFNPALFLPVIGGTRSYIWSWMVMGLGCLFILLGTIIFKLML